jgi:hypothetical protein
MSPDMLTLVAAVLAYDRALETCERMSSFSEFLYAISETSEEKDMVPPCSSNTSEIELRGTKEGIKSG